MSAVAQPSGTVTLVFTDIEGSTRLLDDLGQDGYRDALADHREVIRESFGRYGGYEVDNQGDSFFYAFTTATGAVGAVREALVDEYQLFLVPVVVGGGKRSLPGNDVRLNLELLDERRFRNGTVYLHYRTRS
jgi:class 3 adenylate cyclase